MRALLVVLAFVVVVAPASAANAVRATLKASSTMPVAGTPWRFEITVDERGTTAVKATTRLHVLRQGTVVGCVRGRAIAPCRGASSGTWISFTDTRKGTVRWPGRFVGSTVTFQATVVASGRSLRLRIPVRVQAR